MPDRTGAAEPVSPEDPALELYRRAFRPLMPPGAAFAMARIAGREPAPFRCEAEAVARAVDKRRDEFLAGRRIARDALARLGIEAGPIPVGPRREPVWPPGVVGSITHRGPFCAAAVAPAGATASIGIDLESAGPLAAELIATVCRGEELAAAETRGEVVPLFAKRLFSLKEAFYKCVDPHLRRFLEFREVEAEFPNGPSGREGRCELRLADARLPHRMAASARWAVHDGFVLSVATRPASDVRAARD